MNLAEAITLREAAKAAYLKSLDAKSYQVGDGSTARSLERNSSTQLQAEYLKWDTEVTKLQNAATGRGRIAYVRGAR